VKKCDFGGFKVTFNEKFAILKLRIFYINAYESKRDETARHTCLGENSGYWPKSLERRILYICGAMCQMFLSNAKKQKAICKTIFLKLSKN
jgi:hypothetical protein